MRGPTAHIDRFTRDRLPPPEDWPDMAFGRFAFNLAVDLTDPMVEKGFGDHVALIGNGRKRSYKELTDWTNRPGHALVADFGLKPGERVLIRLANNLAMVACGLTATKTGAVFVNTMPMLRAGELGAIVDKAEIALALCDTRLMAEMGACAAASAHLKCVVGFGASAALLEQASPDDLMEIIEKHRATICFTAPTAYRAMLKALDEGADLTSLRAAISAGETLPAPVYEEWRAKTGKPMRDGIGTMEVLHIFLTNRFDDHSPACTGRPVTGYEARSVDETMAEVSRGTIGRLAVPGPTGCRYLDDPRQKAHVRAGWTLTGDSCWQDEAGRFHFAARSDDMIISAGYNIAGPEVEAALLAHPAVIGAPDEERGMIVEAHVVLAQGEASDAVMVRRLQDDVKSGIAPYKYPRRVIFVAALPKTQTGKIQRFQLRKG